MAQNHPQTNPVLPSGGRTSQSDTIRPHLSLNISPRSRTYPPERSPVSVLSENDRHLQRDSDSVDLSPLEGSDLSRLSGFPQLSMVDFESTDDLSFQSGFGTLNSRPTSQASNLMLLNTSAPGRTRSRGQQAPRIPYIPAVHRGQDSESWAPGDTPPPYTRYPDPPQQPGSVAQHPGYGAGLYHGRGILPLTLQDVQPRGFSAHRMEQRQKRTEAQQTRLGAGWFWPAGRFREGTNEKLPMSRRKKWYLILGIVLVCVIIAVIVGAVCGRYARRPRTEDAGDAGDAATVSLPEPVSNVTTDSGLPALQLGTMVVRPFQKAAVQDNCVEPSKYWSCALPPDTMFPKTTGISDNEPVPEFRFTISEGIKDQEDPKPDAPLYSDYLKMIKADGATDEYHDVTLYTISLTTKKDAVRPTSSGFPSDMLPDQAMNQPLRLFNRGQESEHYGFHIYFRKTIHFDGSDRVPGSSQLAEGGVMIRDVTTRILWGRTRFRVAIYTRRERTSAGDVPVEVWEDRLVGDVDPFKRNIQRDLVEGGKVVWGENKAVSEQGAGDPDNTFWGQKRGCSCRWANFKME